MPCRPHESYAQISVVHPRNGVAVIEFRGEYDLTTKSTTTKLMDEALAENDLLVLDLSETKFIDSSFLHSMVLIDKQAKASGKHVRIQLGTEPIVERALEVSGILAVIDRVHTREEALK